LKIVRDVLEEKKRVETAQTISLAWLSHYFGLSRGKSWRKHLMNLGLLQKKILSEKERDELIKEAHEKARRIMEKDKRKK
jgi:hypothetical protein